MTTIKSAKIDKVTVSVSELQELINKGITEAMTKVVFPQKRITTANRTESMEALASRLLKEKASEENIEKAFMAAYLLKGKTDKTFIKPRIAIYMNIATKRCAGWLREQAEAEKIEAENKAKAKREATAKALATKQANKAKNTPLTAKQVAMADIKADVISVNGTKDSLIS